MYILQYRQWKINRNKFISCWYHKNNIYNHYTISLYILYTHFTISYQTIIRLSPACTYFILPILFKFSHTYTHLYPTYGLDLLYLSLPCISILRLQHLAFFFFFSIILIHLSFPTQLTFSSNPLLSPSLLKFLILSSRILPSLHSIYFFHTGYLRLDTVQLDTTGFDWLIVLVTLGSTGWYDWLCLIVLCPIIIVKPPYLLSPHIFPCLIRSFISYTFFSHFIP